MLCVVAAAPFLSLYLRHFQPPAGVPTGFLIEDLPAYSAQGRAAFERGNGFAFPNPGLPDANAPAIYFHWLSWLLGLGITKFGFDPGVQWVCVGVVAALLCAWLTLLLVEAVLPDHRFGAFLYLITMWGGGFLCIGGVIVSLLLGNSPGRELLRFDPGGGWWFLNWGRNLVFPNEAAYHAVVAACWLAALKDRWGLAILFGAAIGATHPFTGFEVLLSLFTYSSAAFVLMPGRRALGRWLLAATPLAAFLWYNLFFLEQFEEHRVVREQMTVPWIAGLLAMVLAYAGVGLLAVFRLISDRGRLDRRAGFMLTCFAVAFLLANHHWFVRPRQPVHFTRGYVWMPLCLLGLPYLQRILAGWRRLLPPASFAVRVTILFALAVSDNAGFLLYYGRAPVLGIVLPDSDWQALDWIRRHDLRGVFLSADRRMTYLAATYTSLRPYYSHWQHTPHYERRVAETEDWFHNGGNPPWLAQIDYILVPTRHARLTLERLKADGRPWHIIYQNAEDTLFGHAPAGP